MIKIVETYKTANSALLLHKARTVLTMLGVIIGVFAVVSLVSLGIGVQNYVTDQFESIGSNVLFVAPGNAGFADDPANTFGRLKFDESHIEAIKTHASDYITVVSPSVRFSGTVEYKTKSYYSSIYAPNYQAQEIFDIYVQEGRFFNQNEEKNKNRVVILGPNVVDELFPNVNPIGKKVDIDDFSYEVIGYTKKKGQDFDDNVYIPYTRAMEDFEIDNFTGIVAKVNDKDNVDLATKQLKYALLRDLDEDDFQVISAEDILESIQNILSILTAAIGAIAGISLLVGGIGIMNIMLVSVTERTKEIGLRKAVGATRRDIALQFLTEAILISMGGGFIGLAFGWLAAYGVRSFVDVRTEVPLWAVALAFGFSVLVGVVFGTYPAVNASKKDPVEALRYE
jgi:putative ABC transport system permease protein